ncbi:MAG: hypothetical protein SGI96_21205 [Bacteroidota bacterium]|nr:hypothetical protein [Bacteroidota bacterium]
MGLGRIQNEDLKTVAQLIASGASAASLPNDDKIWVTANGILKTLKQAIEDGDLSGGGLETYTQEMPSGTVNGANVTFTVAGTPSAVRRYFKEVPSGTVNSSNTVFTLANIPVSSSLKLTVNGLLKRLTTDYTLAGSTVTFVVAPTTGSNLYADYGNDDLKTFYLYRNGILVQQGSGLTKYTISGSTITFGTAPLTGTDLYCEYNTNFREIQEVPSGTVNGSNAVFITSLSPVGSSIMRVWLDGLEQRLTTDYTFSGNTITYMPAPSIGQLPYCGYEF